MFEDGGQHNTQREDGPEPGPSGPFQLLLDALPDCAFWTLDPAGRVAGWSAGAQRLLGFRADEVHGAPLARFYLATEVERRHPERALALAARLERFEDEGLRVRRDGSTFWAQVAITALRDGEQVTGFAVLVRDLSEQRRAKERVREAKREEESRVRAEQVAARSRLLADAARTFAEAVPRVDRALEAVTHRVAELLGESCVVALADASGQLRPAAVAHPDPEGRRLLRELVASSYGHPAALPMQVFLTGVPLLFTQACADTRLAENAVVHAFCERFGASSLILVPLRARGRAIGVIGVTRGVELEPYDAGDQALLQQLADFAAIALENARLFEDARQARAEAVEARERVEAAAERARDQRQWLESVLDTMPTPLILVEPGSHRITFANRAAHALAGGRFPLPGSEVELCARFRCADANGQPIPEEGMPSVRASRGEEVCRIPMVWHLPDGSTRSLQTSARLLPAAHGHAATALVSFEDVTEHKRVQSELEQAILVRDNFLSIAGHELRTPLTTLQLQLQSLGRIALLDGKISFEKAARKLEASNRQTERLAVLIGQLLDVSRINAGRLTLELQPVDLAALVRDVAARFEDEAERVGCAIQVCAQGRWVGRWDRERLDQVLTNLVSNAIKYGRGKPVEVSLEGDEHHARLLVRDHGIGIAPGDQARIFDRFERAVSDRHYGGLGLGLWIVREIVRALGGTVRLESAPGEGSLFVVEFPVAAAG